MRYQVFYDGKSNETGRVRSFLLSTNLDIIIEAVIVGIEYDYPIQCWMRESGKTETAISLEVLLDTAAFFASMDSGSTYERHKSVPSHCNEIVGNLKEEHQRPSEGTRESYSLYARRRS